MNECQEFLARLTEVMNTAPAGCSRWAFDVLEMFENNFEEELWPEDEE